MTRGFLVRMGSALALVVTLAFLHGCVRCSWTETALVPETQPHGYVVFYAVVFGPETDPRARPPRNDYPRVKGLQAPGEDMHKRPLRTGPASIEPMGAGSARKAGSILLYEQYSVCLFRVPPGRNKFVVHEGNAHIPCWVEVNEGMVTPVRLTYRELARVGVPGGVQVRFGLTAAEESPLPFAGPEAADRLVRMLDDADPDQRFLGAYVLAQRRATDALAPLDEMALWDDSEDCRFAARQARVKIQQGEKP